MVEPQPQSEPEPEPERPLSEALSARMIQQFFGPTLHGAVYHAMFNTADFDASGPIALEDALTATFEEIYLQLEAEEEAARLAECTEVLDALTEQVLEGEVEERVGGWLSELITQVELDNPEPEPEEEDKGYNSETVMLRYRARSEGLVSDGAFTPGRGDGPGGQPESIVLGKLEVGQVRAMRTMRVELIGNFKPCMTEIYLPI